MFDHILRLARACVTNNQYYMTRHAQYKMYDDDLTLAEIEQVFLEGDVIERQKDRITREAKYRIHSITLSGSVEIIFKFALDGKLAIITVYKL